MPSSSAVSSQSGGYCLVSLIQGKFECCCCFQSNSLLLTLIVNGNGFVGDEDDFFVSLMLEVDTSNNNTDTDTDNNEVRVPFSVGAQSDISVDM